jgi:hypothetical protein
MKHLATVAAAVLFLASSACLGYERTSTLGPSSTGIAALVGSWTSTGTLPSPSSCTDFRWDVTEQTGNSVRGSFTATCPGDLRVSGTASGTLTGSTVNWTAQGTATVANLPSCAISLTGTAEIATDSVRVPYSGTTCLGPVSGTEVLRRR